MLLANPYPDQAMESVFVLLDTNTFLHYVSLEQVDWTELFPDKHVVLFICSPVIRELNKQKDTPRNSKIRDRASTALRKIDRWIDSPPPIILRTAVEVRFRVHDASIDFAVNSLVRDIADDHIIATFIELQAAALPTPVVLLTRDTGLKLKARTRGFSVASLPDSTLLPEEVLPSEKKIKELEAQVLELQNTRPKLRLVFSDGSDKVNLTFQRAEQLTESGINNRMAVQRYKYPKMVEPSAEPAANLEPGSLLGMLSAASKYSGIDTGSIQRYNERLEPFFEEYETYLSELAAFYTWESRTAAINISLVNDGSCPGEDIDILMHFPDGFVLFDEEEYKKEPEAPKPPRKPRSIFEEAAAGFPLGTVTNFYPADLGRFNLPHVPSNVSGPKITRTKSFDVKVKVRKAKHGFEEALDIMYLTFESESDKRGFAIDYEIHATNLPIYASGKLNVIV